MALLRWVNVNFGQILQIEMLLAALLIAFAFTAPCIPPRSCRARKNRHAAAQC
jgi:hypothetical protein